MKKLSAHALFSRLLAASVLSVLSACGSPPEQRVAPVETAQAWSVSRAVHTDNSMITLLDPSDLVHHQSEPYNWYLHDFAIQDDLQTGRFAAVVTNRSGKFNVRVTFGELSAAEQQVAGPEGKLRLRVINNRLLLSGGDTWPSEDVDYKRFAYDERWIGVPNGDYGVIITALKPGAAQHDYVFQLIKVNSMSVVKHAPAVPKLIYGQGAQVVNVDAKGFRFAEQCLDVPGTATWAPLSSSTMPIPGSTQNVVLPRSMHQSALIQQQSGSNAALPIVLSRYPEIGAYGFYLKPSTWSQEQLQANGDVKVRAFIRCAVQITDVTATPDAFDLQIKAIPTAQDRLARRQKQQLVNDFDVWLRATNDPAWHFKTAKVKRSTDDAALILGIVDYLNLSVKEAENMLPLSNALRVDYLLDKLQRP